ncbi:expressed unknown protein [Seminavis robusta]|uniref:Uncharacterized protein n=1 Tax=Seminavis robusta TaxID=568900 RepID=A0A9N8HV60_9STRA|nr:expressed unknown protein [Seminavis robusta]|eukprot:Sro2247_g320600.1 n/a (273) ;mRNA; r:2219-3037
MRPSLIAKIPPILYALTVLVGSIGGVCFHVYACFHNEGKQGTTVNRRKNPTPPRRVPSRYPTKSCQLSLREIDLEPQEEPWIRLHTQAPTRIITPRNHSQEQETTQILVYEESFAAVEVPADAPVDIDVDTNLTFLPYAANSSVTAFLSPSYPSILSNNITYTTAVDVPAADHVDIDVDTNLTFLPYPATSNIAAVAFLSPSYPSFLSNNITYTTTVDDDREDKIFKMSPMQQRLAQLRHKLQSLNEQERETNQIHQKKIQLPYINFVWSHG